ncbi:glycosyltransferase [Algoriphagus sp. AK58]|uniref:glycosyltransferase n=1 Tax=Algoriphagus sp. AK58 TaxID=1406877 RepID=UPI001650044D|nr:glycosyltransferase [Algoriphagus sp. AK58]MBC6367460.1 hypothetical protein [Algoriphagus sp. AK58]
MRKKILIFTTNPLHNAPRVIREIQSLISDFDIYVTGETPPTEGRVNFIFSNRFKYSYFEKALGLVYRLLFLGMPFKGRFFSTQWKINKLLKEINPELVIVHPAAFLPYFMRKDRKFKVVFNAHEYHPLEMENNPKWKKNWGIIYSYIYQTYLSKVDLLINVNQEIADECERNFSVKSLVIPNAALYHSTSSYVSSFNFPLKFIHHGIPNPDRKLEIMIKAFEALGDSYQLDLMLINNGTSYYNHLSLLASKTSNVRLIPTVSFKEIIPFISKYDLGVYALFPDSFNNKMALPNKFFEFIQARLPIVIGPSPVMSYYIEEYKIGKVSSDFTPDSLAETIHSLSREELFTFKSNLDRAAKELCMENFELLLLKSVKSLW